MKRFAIFALFVLAALGQTPSPNSQALIQEGIQAFKAARYAQAAQLFQQAVNLSPNDATAQTYLGTAYLSQWIPGANSVENQQFADAAQRAFEAALRVDDRNIQALESLASIKYQQAVALPSLEEKARALDEAALAYDRLTRADSANPRAWYTLGVIAWTKAYPYMMKARQTAGMRPEDPGPIRDLAARLEFRTRYAQTVDEGIRHLEQALALDPKYDDAMAYRNLLHRLRADMQDDEAGVQREIAEADRWVQQALETKKEKAQQFQAMAGSGALAPGRVVISRQPVPGGIAGSVPGGMPPGTGGVIAGLIGSVPSVAPQPPPPPARERAGMPTQIRVGGNVQAAKLLNSPQPVYPPLARQARIQGVVRFNATVSREGKISRADVISGHPLLIEAARQAVIEYVYQPTLLNGQPVEVLTTVDLNFTLSE